MLKRFRSAAVAMAALMVSSALVWGAGNWSTLPIVGSASFCASTVTGTGSLGGITGQGQGSTGSICAQTIPAGPSILTGSELVPADTSLAGGASPQTVVIPMASLNALPLNVSTVISATTTPVTATNLTGGYIFHSTGTITGVNVALPPAPIDGQQFAISADQTITTLAITATSPQTIAKNPTVLTSSTTGTYGYRLMYNATLTTWIRLQ